MKNKRLIIILLTVILLMLIPLTAMQFTNEVNWALSDFLVAGCLLLGTGLLFEFAMRNVRKQGLRIAIVLAFFAILLLTWAELAVGIFGTSFAGS